MESCITRHQIIYSQNQHQLSEELIYTSCISMLHSQWIDKSQKSLTSNFLLLILRNFLFFCLQWQCSACKTNSVKFIWMHYMMCCKHICVCMQRQWQSITTSTWPTAIINSFGFRKVNMSKNAHLQPKGHLLSVIVLISPANVRKIRKEKLY